MTAADQGANDFAAAVQRAAAAWRWVPYDAQRVAVAGQELIVRGQEARIHLAGAPDAVLVDAVHRRAAEAGAQAVTWVVAEPERPAAGVAAAAVPVPPVLVEAGAVCVEELELSACPLPLPALSSGDPPAGLRLRRVDTEQLLDQAYHLDAEVFGTPPRSGAYRREAAAALRAQLEQERTPGVVGSGPCRYLMLVDGDQRAGAGPGDDVPGLAVATAGVTVVDAVARLWGAAVLPAYRGRGLFRVLLAALLRRGSAAGATLALTRARVDTTAGGAAPGGVRRVWSGASLSDQGLKTVVVSIIMSRMCCVTQRPTVATRSYGGHSG
ncbi:hypothetical protein JQS43_24625 [Natronosporangium hydrolyticum]|uniref:N-acetyltransferase domain-containing protein n=1 Tax=Natronosporangium hydrolyticum TaxID=2811111 RepID=A0A895YGU1_9ACTN|nr:GNAT family N-acetyltransferase [Natronosporangium hydrolyticum]QSB14613.1 hypothetical protein JQS43_24625 [Natronosporangium hydrolyticum]